MKKLLLTLVLLGTSIVEGVHITRRDHSGGIFEDAKEFFRKGKEFKKPNRDHYPLGKKGTTAYKKALNDYEKRIHLAEQGPGINYTGGN